MSENYFTSKEYTLDYMRGFCSPDGGAHARTLVAKCFVAVSEMDFDLDNWGLELWESALIVDLIAAPWQEQDKIMQRAEKGMKDLNTRGDYL